MRKILHIDMDAFFASVEQMDHPHLRGKPIIVGGKINQRGVVATCSYEARAFGVRSAMPTSKAIRLCPKAIIIPPNFERYRQLSLQIREIFHRYTPLVEPMSIDEAYLDVTENSKNQTSATMIAREIQEAIYKEIGLTCSVGVSFNKFLAKIASGQRKPAGITVIDQESFPEFIKTLPVENFFGVGQATTKKLHQKKLFTGEDILNCSKEYLIEHFGKQGEALYRQVRGKSNDQLTLYRERKSYGKEETLLEDTTDEEVLQQYIEQFSKQLSKWLKKNNLAAKTITIKLKQSDFETKTRSKTLEEYIQTKEKIALEANHLLIESYENESIRLIGLSISQFEQTHHLFEQVKLF